jgi:hypothetical protein
MAKVVALRTKEIVALLKNGKATRQEISARTGVAPSTVSAIKAHAAMGHYQRAAPSASNSPAVIKAMATARWARIMVKWLISSVRSKRGWEIVNFTGPTGAESGGIVDFMAIRKDHRTTAVPRGDLFEIILIQVKGGSARRPSDEDVSRLRLVADYYHAREVVLAEWMKGSAPVCFTLNLQRNAPPEEQWIPSADPKALFA